MAPDPCPLLPPATTPAGAADGTPAHHVGAPRDARFFDHALRHAQQFWLRGRPAQALLQLNRALAVEPAHTGASARLPYAAIVWILRQPHTGYLGNPVRHYQHLATRVNEPARALRSWRAWACFHLAAAVLPAAGFPRDEEQIATEALEIPAWPAVLEALAQLGAPGEAALLAALRAGLPGAPA